MAKKYLDENGVLYFWQKIKSKLTNYVEKVDGKQLSTNDYTTADKNKLAGISDSADAVSFNRTLDTGTKIGTITINGVATDIYSEKDTDTTYEVATTTANGLMSSTDKAKLDSVKNGAQVNTIETVKVNNTALTITDKTVNISVPTNNNQLANGAGYQTETQVNNLISEAIGEMTGIDYQIVESLPTTGLKGIIYLVSNSGSTPNSYDEYIWLNDKFEKIGTTAVDLSGYLQEADLVAITNAEIDTITAS